MTTPNTDGLPAPEARVREFLEALAQENAAEVLVGGTEQDELAWAVPDDGSGLRSLTASDLRDVLGELAAAREALERVEALADAHPWIVPGVVIRAAIEGSA